MDDSHFNAFTDFLNLHVIFICTLTQVFALILADKSSLQVSVGQSTAGRVHVLTKVV